jgi:hypothetical protein
MRMSLSHRSEVRVRPEIDEPLKRAMLELKGDRFAVMKAEYEKAGPEPSNTRYGYVVPQRPMDHSVFA